MKISIGSHVVKGPWGGGNLFVINLSNYLIKKGHTVIYDLIDDDIDLILLTDPRGKNSSSSSFDHNDIKTYKKHVNPNAVVVHRINECDERKQTTGLNDFYLRASEVANKVVFVSEWLKNIFLDLGMSSNKSSVILSGSDKDIFNNINSSTWKKDSKLKLITHHWSANLNKGYAVYKQLDDLISTKKWKDKIEFTYIGNISDEFNLLNTKIISPKEGDELAKILKDSHVYVTGSINEPSGNHHIEGAQCGLPILFLDSGGTTEYCRDFGLGFTDDFELKLEQIIADYDLYRKKMDQYPLNSEIMSEEYLTLFKNLVDNRNVKNQKVNIKGRLFLLNQLNKKYFRIFKLFLKTYF